MCVCVCARVLGGVISPWDRSRGRSPHQPPPHLPEHTAQRNISSAVSMMTLKSFLLLCFGHFHFMSAVAVNSLTSSSASSPSSSYCKTQK